ncbi:MAG: histidine--tRNA ligase [Candidatus Acidiferrales bacterium]
MSERNQFRTIRGTRDILPADSSLWRRVEQVAREVFSSYGFGEIRLPILEQTALFARAVGADTDIVGKEMFTLEDRPPDLPDPRTKILTAEDIGTLEDAMRRGAIPNSESNRSTVGRLALWLNRQDLSQLTIADYKRLVGEYLLLVPLIQLGDSLALRPEATASVARAYIQHGMQSWPHPVKLYYTGPMFRRERPQKGRYRQFYQIGAEVFGKTDEPTLDSEAIEMVVRFLDRVGLIGTTLYINSIGCKECRPKYVALLRDKLRQVKDQLGPDSQRRIETNPLRVLDSKIPKEQEIILRLPRISDHLCGSCRDHFSKVKDELHLRGIGYQENWRLVRGLDYYMRTTFEVTAPGLGSQNAVCGGGRYDGLVELLGGPPTPAVGFAIGTDRLVLALNEQRAPREGPEQDVSHTPSATERPDVVVCGTSDETWRRAAVLAGSLRKNGLSVYLPKSGAKLQRVLETAHKMGTQVVIIVGENELKSNQYAVRILSPLIPDEKRDVQVEDGRVLLYGKIVKLRQDLEKALAGLSGGKTVFDGQNSISRMIDRLVASGILPSTMAQAIRDVVPTLNRAIHGQPMTDGSVDRALAYGNLLLNEIQQSTPLEE